MEIRVPWDSFFGFFWVAILIDCKNRYSMNLAIIPNIQEKRCALERIEFTMWWASVLWPPQSINNQCSSSAIIIRNLWKKKIKRDYLQALEVRQQTGLHSEIRSRNEHTGLVVEDEGLGFRVRQVPIGELETWGRRKKNQKNRKPRGNSLAVQRKHFPCWGPKFSPWGGN